MYHQFVFVTRSVFSPSKSGPQTCFFSKVSPMGFVIGDTFLSLVYRWFMTPMSVIPDLQFTYFKISSCKFTNL